MPVTKKRKTVKKASNVMQTQVTQMSEQMNMLLVVFSIAMMAFAFVLFKVYVK